MAITARRKLAMAQAHKYQPLGNRVLIKRDDSSSITIGGIHLPDMAKERKATGTVIAVGDGLVRKDGSRIPINLESGDRVIFGLYARENADLGDEDLIIVPEPDVFCKEKR